MVFAITTIWDVWVVPSIPGLWSGSWKYSKGWVAMEFVPRIIRLHLNSWTYVIKWDLLLWMKHLTCGRKERHFMTITWIGMIGTKRTWRTRCCATGIILLFLFGASEMKYLNSGVGKTIKTARGPLSRV